MNDRFKKVLFFYFMHSVEQTSKFRFKGPFVKLSTLCDELYYRVVLNTVSPSEGENKAFAFLDYTKF